MLKTNLGIIVALVTLISTVLIGGATFGDVRGTSAANTRAIEVQNQRFMALEANVREINDRSIQMISDLRWIKDQMAREYIQNRGTQGSVGAR